jgi:hypothetical protein
MRLLVHPRHEFWMRADGIMQANNTAWFDLLHERLSHTVCIRIKPIPDFTAKQDHLVTHPPNIEL